MKLVLSILRGEVTSNRNKVELYCVGTGTGTTGNLNSIKVNFCVDFAGAIKKEKKKRLINTKYRHLNKGIYCRFKTLNA